MRRKVWLKLSIPLLLLALLQGCGFHLRGTQEGSRFALPAGTGPVYIQGLARGDYLRLQLEERLITSDAGMAAAAEQGKSRLRIGSRVSDRRVLAVDSSGKVIEYELRESLSFSLSDAGGAMRVPEQSITLIQSYINPETEVLGGAQEEQRLRQDMWQRMADQIMRRLAAQLR
ncbi:MAG: hypothetical protein KDI68_14700 [Gammaproteobacteria bacterium]|nr:hypothetical protein [Gammaproteobacteria bacterium]